MQKYKCHKIVEALKIETIKVDFDGSVLYAENGDYIAPADGYFHKHEPQCGGYYVRYEDGYESYSPPEAFEAGYTELEGAEDEAKGEACMAAMSAGLLALLDRIAVEGDPSLASQRFQIAEALGMNVVFEREGSTEAH